MFNTHFSDIKKVFNFMCFCKIAGDFAGCSGIDICIWSKVVIYQINMFWIEDVSKSHAEELIHGNMCSDIVG